MNNNFDLAVEKFLDKWATLDEFNGAILSGSYAVGTQSNNSDVDIMIVLSDKTDWWQRGNLIVDDIMIEYIADPAAMWKKAFDDELKSGSRVSVSMFAIGKVLLDKSGEVAKLKAIAEQIMSKPLPKLEGRALEMAKYHLWDRLTKLQHIKQDGFVQYAPMYYLHLSNIIGAYAKFLGIPIPSTSKLYRFLVDSDFRTKYKLEGFNDDYFVDLIKSCLENYSNIDAIEKVTNYVMDKLGGFNINGWELRTKIEKI
jgi:predicted nucleotidyltransferase